MSEADPKLRVIPLEALDEVALLRYHTLGVIGKHGGEGISEEQLLGILAVQISKLKVKSKARFRVICFSKRFS